MANLSDVTRPAADLEVGILYSSTNECDVGRRLPAQLCDGVGSVAPDVASSDSEACRVSAELRSGRG
jgi:hypothetical protein